MKARTISILMTALILAALTLGTALAGSNSTTLPNGAQLAVSVDNPETCTEFLVDAGAADRSVDFSGTASVGLGEPDATLVYVMDVSGSTDAGSGTGCSPILGCEKQFVIALNNAAIADGSVDEVGLVVYADTGATGDMSPDGGDQLIVAPDADSNVSTVVNSTYSDVGGGNGGVGQYTNRAVGQFTNFTAGLQKALTVVNASTNGTNIVIFVSDGLANRGGPGFNAAVTAMANAGAVVYSIAAGTGSSCTTNQGHGTLQAMADATGGSCFYVPDPGNLPDIIPDLISSALDSLEIEVDSGGKSPISNDDIDPDLPQPGAVTVNYATAAAGLSPADHTICITANGSDAAGTGSVTQCETIHLFQIELNPESASNELGTPPQDHTVVATILGDYQIQGRGVDFEVLSGPNAGKAGNGVTDGGGQVPFTYEATPGCDGLGQDQIEACFTLNDPTGATGCDYATKDWVDTTPPSVDCVETENPHGGNTPPGKNPDGFFELVAEDAVDPDPQIWVRDTGSGQEFGPFSNGTTIKYTEAPGAVPKQKKMGSDKGQAEHIDWHIIGNGDACVYAVDCAGNVSVCVNCLVPPPPK